MFHRSERLFLRPIVSEDWDAINRGLWDERVAKMLACAPWPYRAQDALKFAARSADSKFPIFAITVPGEQGAPLIGVADLRQHDGEAAIGFWLARDWWGHGYASEAVRALCKVAHAIGHRRLHAVHFLDNPQSARVLRKAGFVETGEVRATECLARGGEQALAGHLTLDLSDSDLVDVAEAMRAA